MRRSIAKPFAIALLATLHLGCNFDALIGSEKDTPPVVDKSWSQIQLPNNRLDVLFVVDNSQSMQPMNDELKARFDEFLTPFMQIAANGRRPDLHVGVITSDYGAGSGGPCQPYGEGQSGKLQAIGQAAPSSCKPPIGKPFIEYRFGDSAQTDVSNLPADQDLLTTFRCMANVGAEGCGFEFTLESTYQALKNQIDNRDFLRDDALLAVVFVTNEDDCSAPGATDLFNKSATQYGYLNSYRCSRFGVVCDGSLLPYSDSGGLLTNCAPAPNPEGAGPGKLFDVARYINLFTKPKAQGGIKENPRDVYLFGIMPPTDPVEIVLSDPRTVSGYYSDYCALLNEQSTPACVPVLQRSCVNDKRPEFFGDPPVRLAAVINAAANHSVSSICADEYAAPMLGMGGAMAQAMTGIGCITEPLENPDAPLCVVEFDVGDGIWQVVPACSENTTPCWTVETKATCPEAIHPVTKRTHHLALTIQGGNFSANTSFRARCQAVHIVNPS